MPSKNLEIWGGLECTINRVRSCYNNQVLLNGHFHRATDLDLFASLGIKKLRYPMLWEAVAPHSFDEMNWEWIDSRMKRIQELDITPIAGLLHHGSGPGYTSLLDPKFPQKLARYAALVAQRYPWIEWYTPVNEPLTTARFSGLYGFWYPHHSNDRSMVRALLNQIKGIVLSMQAIRTVNPQAKLIQTEDIGRALATASVQYQADFENIRRWLTFDLLLGKVDRLHPAFQYLIKQGATRAELAWLQINSFPIDILGINHYPLSNRFLDHRLELYPERYHGGNGKDHYADVGAVDSGQVIPPAPIDVYREVWERYQRPIAVTEAHIGGPREAQMRWL
ncbi:MAG TPA: family 1 glycosylhydrolase, partial [Nitrosomonas sp.]|nr:family 1 glycosylhydrolase [Nitrosomonas sp.]